MLMEKEYATRRKNLLNKLAKDSAAVFFSSTECLRNGDVHFPFRQNSDFYYFTGFSEPETVALFLPDHEEGEFFLFVRQHDPLMERWIGPCCGQRGACERYGADQAFEIGQLDEKIIELLAGRKEIFYPLGQNKNWDQKINEWVTQLQTHNRKNRPCLKSLSDITAMTHEMRIIKSRGEMELLKKAAQISAQAHIKLMQLCKPGLYEYQLEAAFDYEIKEKGCRSTAYPTIVGGGANACILHYIANKDPLKDGDLVLVDAGGEFENYAADITRTFPVNGKFTKEQATIYEIVLQAQEAVIESIRPGIPWNHLQEIAVNSIAKGLLEVGIFKGSLTDIIEKKSYQNYYMHNIGHWLGLDVHDAGLYKKNDQWRPLEPGMVLTVEPGLYLFANDELDPKWWNIGVRIEDDVAVTDQGCEVLTAKVPKSIQEIEAIMGNTLPA